MQMMQGDGVLVFFSVARRAALTPSVIAPGGPLPHDWHA